VGPNSHQFSQIAGYNGINPNKDYPITLVLTAFVACCYYGQALTKPFYMASVAIAMVGFMVREGKLSTNDIF
jgi:hypothetical protein